MGEGEVDRPRHFRTPLVLEAASHRPREVGRVKEGKPVPGWNYRLRHPVLRLRRRLEQSPRNT